MSSKRPQSQTRGVYWDNGSWYARLAGKRVAFGSGPEGKRLAEKAKKEYDSAKLKQKEDLGKLRAVSEFNTLGDVLDYWIKEQRYQSVSTLKIYHIECSMLKRYFKDISLQDWKENARTYQNNFIEKAKKTAKATITISKKLKILKRALQFSADDEKIPQVYIPRKWVHEQYGFVKEIDRKIIMKEEYDQLMKHIDVVDDTFADLMVCIWEVPIREAVWFKLRGSQIILNKVSEKDGSIIDFIHSTAGDEKTGKAHDFPVSARAKEVLLRRMDGKGPNDLIFKIPQVRPGSYVAYRLEKLCNAAGIIYGNNRVNEKGERVGICFHGFKGSFVIQKTREGYSDNIIRAITGHKSIEVYLKHYAKVDQLGIENLMKVVK